jgi:amyloid beta precursor protein binding protein 1
MLSIQQTPLVWYIALRAADAFYQKYGRWPGSNFSDSTKQLEHDQKEVFSLMRGIAGERGYDLPKELIGNEEEEEENNNYNDNDEMETEEQEEDRQQQRGSSALITRAHAMEITRYGGCELHNICSVIGGVASQEVVKIITHQYQPFDNTFIFNGIACCGAVYSL